MNETIMNPAIIFKTKSDNEQLTTKTICKLMKVKIYEFGVTLRSQINRILPVIRRLAVFRSVSKIFRGLACVLFVSAPGQEQIEQVRTKASQYGRIF